MFRNGGLLRDRSIKYTRERAESADKTEIGVLGLDHKETNTIVGI